MNHNYLKKGKVLLSAFLLLICFSCKKNQDSVENSNGITPKTEAVSAKLAGQVAISFLQDMQSAGHVQGKRMSATSTQNVAFDKEISSTRTIKEKKGYDLFYIINFKPSGFAIVSATKKNQPILAYSESGSFDYEKAKYGIKEWLSVTSSGIDYLISQDVRADSSSVALWKMYSPRTEVSVNDAPEPGHEVTVPGTTVYDNYGPLVKTEWDQGSGYNEGVPSSYGCSDYSNGKPPIGCVATAMGQIMNFWKFPSNFNWNDMPNRGGYGSIPNLLYTAATAVNMSFGCGGSGATMVNAQNALRNFGYRNSKLENYSEFWLKYEIQSGRSVLLSGDDQDRGAAHAWVCDGYQQYVFQWIHNPNTPYQNIDYTYSIAMLHMNWGWGTYGAEYNGYYSLGNFNPSAYNGSVPSGYKYNKDIKMITNIYPVN